MPDCGRNGLLRCGGIAEIGGRNQDIDIRRLHQAVRDLLELRRIAGHQAKMHAFSGEFGCNGSTNSSVGTGYQRNLFI